MSILTLDWETLTIIIVALFALSGFLRGWWREGITTIFLILLTIFLTSPELAGSIIEFINGIIETAWGILTGLFETLGIAEATVAAASTPPIVINPDDRTVFVIILIIMVLLSYFTSKITLGGRTITFGGRIFGGILGAINGFLAVNLVKEYIVGRFFPETGLSAQTAAPDELSIAITNVPPESVFTDTSQLLVIGLGVIVLALILANRLTSKGARRDPWGYKPAKK
jgi:hypothetical protein